MQTLLFSFRSFARQHDELPAFHAAAIVLTFVIASLCTTGFFLLVITAHACLDLVKFHDVHGLSWRASTAQAMRSTIVMFTLLLTGLTASMYLHPSLGIIAGLSGIALAEASVLRGMATVLPKFMALQQLSGRAAGLLDWTDLERPRAFGPSERSYLAVLVTLVLLLSAAPILLNVPLSTYLLVLRIELTPGLL